MRRQKADVSILYAVFKGDKSENNSTFGKNEAGKAEAAAAAGRTVSSVRSTLQWNIGCVMLLFELTR